MFLLREHQCLRNSEVYWVAEGIGNYLDNVRTVGKYPQNMLNIRHNEQELLLAGGC